MNDRYGRTSGRDYYGGDTGGDYNRDYGSGRDQGYSSARDYAAAGWRGGNERDRDNGDYQDRSDWRSQHGGGNDWGRGRDEGHRDRGGYGAQGYGAQNYGSQGFASQRGGYGANQQQGGRGYDRDGRSAQDRGFFERAGDEVRSWFGDEDAERRRERDQRYDAQQGRGERHSAGSTHDDHYHSWRRERIAELDRDYDEYRRENAQRFHNEFTSWRTDRQGQRDQLGRVNEHMDVVGSDGSHVGTVDKVRGDRIVLTKNDAEAGGRHHSIPSRWIQSVDDKVTLRKTADEAKQHWKDEERSGAFFGEDKRDEPSDWGSAVGASRSYSGPY